MPKVRSYKVSRKKKFNSDIFQYFLLEIFKILKNDDANFYLV